MDDREIVKRIAGIIGKGKTEDDCAKIPFGDIYIVASTDMLHEKTDFPKGCTDRQAGWMSASVTLSDIASSGAKPACILLAAGLDREDRIDGITKGAFECCKKFGAELCGGDVDSHDELTIVTTGIGIVRKEDYVSRKGAKKGDAVYVCGNLGHAQKGLCGDRRYFKDLCEPQPKVFEGTLLGKAHVSCMMDVSDGLAVSLFDLSDLNGCGFDIDKNLVPLSEGIGFDTAFYYGGDFGLLYTCSESLHEKNSLPGIKIGYVSENKGVRISGTDAERKGYSHTWDKQD
ncbi:thiamine-monophosphate kinase [Methanomicrobium sp. W14]|uniref:thiamine-phosphate kinase n=1 Tax=Methanomicrobium sp. W14 TaxID=2817839 RepID=UPI001AE16FBD|nr:thiamine-phosphate kinase [Methanomicrobium sp. W14]MBP2134324.1 thiamine-monophosphate kinase [Methanomicrobium sp. W14]